MKPFQSSLDNPRLRMAAIAMNRNDIPQAERLLKAHLFDAPTDVPAIRMLAEVAARLGREEDALKLLERCLELAPGFAPARYQLAVHLHRRNEAARALAEAERLLVDDPRNPGYRNLAAVILSRVGEYERASSLYADLVKEYPANAKVWLGYGHVLKTEGRQDESIAAYRRAITHDPAFGEAWWSLANLKTFRFSETDFAAMRSRVADPTVDEANRVHLHFALGKAYEDAGDHAASFDHYAKGNALHRALNPYDANVNTRRAERLKSVFTKAYFDAHPGGGCTDASPIFIVGMPRSGSTLLEQILSSHSMVEGTTELPELITMARELRELAESEDIGAYADVLAAMPPESLRALGERYLDRTRVHRKTSCPQFIDKMPNNFLHAAMIHLALPNARIIDARRHPMACCFSNFKQHYARGQRFSYDLTDMGRYYRDYVSLMAHFDEALPGRIHRVFYERLVEDTEAEIRGVLEYCGLPFEAGCLRFFENERPVRTASSEQVRQPIYREGMDQWRHFETWLNPLKTALGAVIAAYPDAPPP
ncbi:MAG: tetratricopeptide repeat-containing sulfotransferase family protein [Steroidobacteraceae bacterium]